MLYRSSELWTGNTCRYNKPSILPYFTWLPVLPGSSIQSAGQRTLFSLIGTLWALLGIEIHHFALSGSESAARSGQPPPPPLSPRLAALRSVLAIGIASALGYTVGLVLGLPRDFWIVVAIIVTVRPTSPTLTVTFTSMMIIGTIAGSLIAAAITLETSNHYLLLALLFCFAVVVFAAVGVNIMITQIVLVPFIIILLNIYYPGQWYLPFIRILNIAIGGTIGVAMVYLLSTLTNSRLSGNREKEGNRKHHRYMLCLCSIGPDDMKII